ncbi:hypothetical protein QBC38DRAFT_208187 [Podospora fimiseda]|uniref:Uncharacterized protein n=1 Tax=Podospora fimiseda TaxID=252190 RepID=A0AAN7BQ32_9PEZI|nr:hypothetical protein QBC38DRAFT_208187 [Podospora fimiseda]
MQLPRQQGEARAKGSGRRTSYRHESRPLTNIAWSTRSPGVAQSGFAEVVLMRVLLRRLPESVRMRLPPLCSASGTAHDKAESRRFHGPDLPRRRKSEGSKATSSLRGRIGRPPCQQGLADPARCILDPAGCGPEVDRRWFKRPIRRFRHRPPACLAAAALAFGPIVAKAGSLIRRLRRLDACTKQFDAIDTCGNFVTGQDAQALRAEWGNGGMGAYLVDMGSDFAGERMYAGRQGDGGWAMGKVRCRSGGKPSGC